MKSQVKLRQTGIVRTIIQAEEKKGVKWPPSPICNSQWSILYNEWSIREHIFMNIRRWESRCGGPYSVAMFLFVRKVYLHNFVIPSSKMESSIPKSWILNENWLLSGVGIVVDKLSWAKWSKWIFISREEDIWVLKC